MEIGPERQRKGHWCLIEIEIEWNIDILFLQEMHNEVSYEADWNQRV